MLRRWLDTPVQDVWPPIQGPSPRSGQEGGAAFLRVLSEVAGEPPPGPPGGVTHGPNRLGPTAPSGPLPRKLPEVAGHPVLRCSTLTRMETVGGSGGEKEPCVPSIGCLPP